MQKPITPDAADPAEPVDSRDQDLLAIVEEQTTASEVTRVAAPHGSLVGSYCGRTPAGDPLVDFSGNPAEEPAPAQSVVPLTTDDAGRSVVLTFEGGDLRRPIILGLIEGPDVTSLPRPLSQELDVRVDGERVTIEAQREVVIKCGAASITLTHAGKVLIRGTYVVSRSSGANKIKGASVDVN